jgi:hypothetical protein
MLQAAKATGQITTQHHHAKNVIRDDDNVPVKLSDAGISLNLSSRAQRIADSGYTGCSNGTNVPKSAKRSRIRIARKLEQMFQARLERVSPWRHPLWPYDYRGSARDLFSNE